VRLLTEFASQVVRADLSELWNMDLKGRSLAYTPFCDSNKEMDGYRYVCLSSAGLTATFSCT
jgi:hypothetical protein